MNLLLTAYFIFSLGCFAPCFLQAEAMRKTPSCPNVVALPGRNGRDGQPGRDGRDGLPGPAVCNCQHLKQEIIEEIKGELLANLTLDPTGHTDQPSPTTQDLPTSTSLGLTSTAAYNPTTAPTQPTPTPPVQPQCTDGLGMSSNPATSCMEIYNCKPCRTVWGILDQKQLRACLLWDEHQALWEHHRWMDESHQYGHDSRQLMSWKLHAFCNIACSNLPGSMHR